VLRWGLLATEDAPTEDAPQDAAGTNPMDAALWQAPAAAAQRDWLDGYRRVAVCPFDHDRRRVSVLVDGPEGGRVLVTKGSPEELLTRCRDVPATVRPLVAEQSRQGARLLAVATRTAPELQDVSPHDEEHLSLVGLLAFHDPPKRAATAALAKLARLGVTVKIITGDHLMVATWVC